MAVIPLGTGDWESVTENVPRLKVRNMYVIENPSSPDGLSRVSRPTLKTISSIGAGPIYATFRQDASLDGDWIVVSGQGVYRYNPLTRESIFIGSAPGTDFPDIAGTADRVLIARNGILYSTDGMTMNEVTIPDDKPVKSVAVINGTFILTIKDSQRFYWINPGETDPDALDFAEAERLPDAIEKVAVLTDEIWFIGTQGPEVWSTTTDPDIPFQRINGRVYNEGCIDKNTVVSSVFNDLPCLLWVTSTGTVVLAQGSVKKISSGSVEEFIKTSNNLRAWQFRANRSDFYVLTSDEATHVYDLRRNEWLRWDSYLKDYWKAHLGLQTGSTVYAGSSQDASIYLLEEGFADDDDYVIREIAGMVSNPGKPVQCASVSVRVNAGWSDSYQKEPVMELRWSDDQGSTYSEYVQVGMGTRGRYNADTIFRSMGLIQRPGRVFEFRFADKARFRLDYATVNEV